jgi:hypothetical protein
LVQRATDNERQLVTVTESLQNADSIEPPSATTTIQSEALGDGNFLVTKSEVPEVFGAESYRKTKEDLTPQKFRAAQEDTTFEETIEGVANPNITLSTGEFSKSEQQVNKFVKRVATTSRAITEAVTLLEKVLTNEGKIGTRILTLASGNQIFTPSATLIEANVEALGDGRTVKTETTIPQIFEAITESIERPDPIPQKFRINNPTRTFQSNVVGTAQAPLLSGSEIAKSEQQVTDFVKRVSTTTRSSSASISTLEGQIYTSELGGGIATVFEAISDNPVLDPSTGTVSSEKENLGNDQFYTRQIKLTAPLPELKGQEYDDTLDVAIPFTRQFVEAGTEAPSEPSSIEPRDTLHSVNNTINTTEAKSRLLDVLYITGTIQGVSLPNVLTSVKLYVDYATESAQSNASGNSATASTTVGVNAGVDLLYDIKDGYQGPADAEQYLFFLPKDQCGLADILSKLNGAQKFPVVLPKTEKFLIRYTTEKKFVSLQASLPNNRSISQSIDRTPQTKTFTIPPTLHSNVTIQTITRGTNSISTSIGVATPTQGSYGVTIDATAELGEAQSTLTATTPTSFPTGRYLYSVTTSPYRFGLVRVEAIVVEITEAMVS